MWSAILWPLAVVAFDAIVFVTALTLVRLAARDHLRAEQQLLAEHETPGIQEPVAATGTPKSPVRVGVHVLEPEKEPSVTR